MKSRKEDSWERMTGIFSVCRKCKYRKGNECGFDGECNAVKEKAEIIAESEFLGVV
jgi:hypothetical protein